MSARDDAGPRILTSQSGGIVAARKEGRTFVRSLPCVLPEFSGVTSAYFVTLIPRARDAISSIIIWDSLSLSLSLSP